MTPSDALLITEQMLLAAAKTRAEVNKVTMPSNDVNPLVREAMLKIMETGGMFSEEPVDHLQPEHTTILLALPLFVTLDLVSIINKERAAKLRRRGVKGDAKNDPKNLKYVTDELLDVITFLTHPSIAPVTKQLVEELLVGMANYIILGTVLRGHLEERDDWEFVGWSGEVDFSNIPWKNRFPYALNLIWLSLFVSLADHRAIPEHDDRGLLHFPIIPVRLDKDLISNLDNNRDTVVYDDSTNTHDIFLMAIHPQNQDEYELALILYPDETDNVLEAVFSSLSQDNDIYMSKNLVNILIKTEQRIEETIKTIQTAWDEFSDKLEDIVIVNPIYVKEWMDKLICHRKLLEVSFDYKALRKSLLTLSDHYQTNLHYEKTSLFDDGCEKYKKNFRKHLIPELVDAFREAMPKIIDLWEVMKLCKNSKDEKKVRQHVLENKRKYDFTTPEQAEKNVAKYLANYANGKRDLIEETLISIAHKYGRNVSRTTIRNLLNSGMI